LALRLCLTDIYRACANVDDLVRAICLPIDAVPVRPMSQGKIEPGDSLSSVTPFWIGNSDKMRLLDFVDALELCLGKKAVRNYLPMQKGDAPATWAEASLVLRLKGYRQHPDVREGIARFVAWFREYHIK
jgi:UDP-glucuronate 4-epimerase